MAMNLGVLNMAFRLRSQIQQGRPVSSSPSSSSSGGATRSGAASSTSPSPARQSQHLVHNYNITQAKPTKSKKGKGRKRAFTWHSQANSVPHLPPIIEEPVFEMLDENGDADPGVVDLTPRSCSPSHRADGVRFPPLTAPHTPSRLRHEQSAAQTNAPCACEHCALGKCVVHRDSTSVNSSSNRARPSSGPARLKTPPIVVQVSDHDDDHNSGGGEQTGVVDAENNTLARFSEQEHAPADHDTHGQSRQQQRQQHDQQHNPHHKQRSPAQQRNAAAKAGSRRQRGRGWTVSTMGTGHALTQGVSAPSPSSPKSPKPSQRLQLSATSLHANSERPRVSAV